jgi:hypothetical protein
MAAHGVAESDIEALARDGTVTAEYRVLVEELMATADRDYDIAFRALPELPRHFRVAVGVAGRVYRGIHDEIRRNGYNNGTLRAHTSGFRKTALAAAALAALTRPRPPRVPIATALALLLTTASLSAQTAQSDTTGERWISAARAHATELERAHDVVRIRALYFSAVDESSLVERGLALAERAHTAAPDELKPVLRGYQGAFITLRAKHGTWPPSRLKAVKEGLAVLDEVVAVAPDHVEVRYLRLMSAYYLPGLFGRKDRVREDFEVLALLLPGERQRFPPDLFRSIAEFVIANSDLDDAALKPLRGALK